MAQITRVAKGQHQKEIIKIFDALQGKHSLWQLWGDFVVMAACTISNAVDASNREKREQLYMSVSSGYGKKELDAFAQVFALIVEAYERDPDQDLLGELYMALGLGNDRNGQFFTPYDICRLMAEMNIDNAAMQIKERGWISVNDPAVGAGALLIAFANACTRKEINYQQHCLFVAQELDFNTACMCYIQLSLLGCSGYVYVGDTITDPCTCLDDNALVPAKPEKCWFMPMYFHPTWGGRLMIAQLRLLERRLFKAPTESAENDSSPAEIPASAPSVQESEPEEIASTIDIISGDNHEIKPTDNDIAPDNNEIALFTNESGQLSLF